ncbi:MAG: hypothetical protein IKL89_02090 [Clostridia bacterium]|nr:hypothetical protein [Clostridia bacterium]
MYKLSVPISLIEFSDARIGELKCELSRIGAERVFITACRSVDSEEQKTNSIPAIRKAAAWLRAEGYEPAVWISSLGHGGSMVEEKGYQYIISADGSYSTDSFCPYDEEFQNEFARWVADLATTGVNMIMLDDDYRLGYRTGSIGCFCPLHLARISELLGGEEITREILMEKAFTGGKNRYRDAWLQACGESLRILAKKLRAAVDSVDPTVRLGHCAVLDTWDIDGVDSITLARDFAGNTAPFLRLIGAAYWGNGNAFGCNIANVIELERMQLTWCEDAGIETFAEGDVFPRPRHQVPAAYLEALDTALRADGRIDGILKYMVDYEVTPFYERGYVDRHVRNKGIAADFSRVFEGKKHAGVRVYECMNRLEEYDFGPRKPDAKYISSDFVPASARLLCDNAIPMQWDEEDVTIVFGENARHIPTDLLKSGAILDGDAAKLLTERGIDVGLRGIEGEFEANYVYYPDKCEGMAFRYGMYGSNGARTLKLLFDANATPLTELRCGDDKAFAYRYENGDGCRFLVFPFEGKRARTTSMLFRNYYMQDLLIDSITWIRRAPLDVTIRRCPDLYLQTAKSEGELAIGLWNMYADAAFIGEVELSESWTDAEFINCSGKLTDGKLILDDIGAYSFGAVLLKK